MSTRAYGAGLRRYLLFAACAAVYLYPFLRVMPGLTDEGTLIQGAVRVTQGGVPFRDFFEAMGPGTFYWLAGFFRVFGTTWFATRLCLFVTSAGTAILLYHLSHRLGVRNRFTPAVVFFGTAYGVLWPAISHHQDSNFFALLAFAIFLGALDSRGQSLMAAGALAGLTTCFLQPKGALLFLSFLAVLLARRRWRNAACLAAGYSAVLVVVIVCFWQAGGLSQLIYANFTWPLTRYDRTNSIPYAMGLFTFYWHRWTSALGPAFSATLLTPFLLIAALPALLGFAAAVLRRRAFDARLWPYWVSGSALWLAEIHRKDIMHLVFGSPLLLILWFYLYERIGRKPARLAIAGVAACAIVLASANLLISLTARTPIATRRGTLYAHGPDVALARLEGEIRPGEKIFAYPYRPLYYFLLDADNATRYSFFTYGLNTEAQFRDAIASLEKKKVKHVIWDTSAEDGSTDWAFPNRKPSPRIMEQYLLEHYAVRDVASGIRLLTRKD